MKKKINILGLFVLVSCTAFSQVRNESDSILIKKQAEEIAKLSKKLDSIANLKKEVVRSTSDSILIKKQTEDFVVLSRKLDSIARVKKDSLKNA
ncbi:MAG: hypothetical protein IAF38_14910, partial [Bacteroidia bacterium]|nr:hypothetical protein [Bacteroidia bacterium]